MVRSEIVRPENAARGLVGMVWAQTPGGVIAADGELPWDVPEDFAHFRATVLDRPVIVGRATWESMPPPWRARRTARSLVVSRSSRWQDEPVPGQVHLAERVGSVEEAIERLWPSKAPDGAAHPGADGQIWIMGGGQIYELGMAEADLLVVTDIDVREPVGTLTFAPRIDPDEWQETTPREIAGWRTSRTGTRWRIRHHRRRS